jgi:phage protein U
MSYATLGDDITFEVKDTKFYTWSKADRSGEGRWSEHLVFAGKPALEFLGPGLDTIMLSIRFDADRGVEPLDEVKRFRLLRDTGAISQFTIGGKLVGDFVVPHLDEELVRHQANGRLQTAIVRVTLKEYA